MWGELFSQINNLLVSLGLDPDMLVVFGVMGLTLFFFVSELIPIDVTAILTIVLLAVLEPWTHITPAEAISGFSNPATITVLAMLILSGGVRRTGLVQIVGNKMAQFAGDNFNKQMLATILAAGPISGFVNNTPVVAILVSVVSDLAHKGKTSPSKLLIPLSYASMLGGMLTLMGTSTNILASELSGRLLNHPFSVFEFTKLGAIVLLVGGAYLLTLGHRLLPERIPAEKDYIEEYKIEPYLTELKVKEGSALVGKTIQQAKEENEFEIFQQHSGEETTLGPPEQRIIQSGDILKIKADRARLERLINGDQLKLIRNPSTEEQIEPEDQSERTLVEVVVPHGSYLVGETIEASTFRERYNASVLAIRSRGEIIKKSLNEVKIHPGDTLLLQALPENIDRLSQNRDFIVAHQVEEPTYRRGKLIPALIIMVGVVVLAALGILPFLIAALAGVVAMIMTGVLRPHELYDSVEWNVIFLLAGVIPLGMALEKVGVPGLVGNIVASTNQVLPVVGVLWVFYIFTGLLTEMISNNASVVVMIPIAISTAQQIGANPFAFVLAVTFAASTAFLGPIGYQTNLFVYGPGGYKVTDYFRIGAPLQLILSVITVGGIALFWGI